MAARGWLRGLSDAAQGAESGGAARLPAVRAKARAQQTEHFRLAAEKLAGERFAAARATPAPSPAGSAFDPMRTPRVQAYGPVLAHWFALIERHPEEFYVSDGDPHAMTHETTMESETNLPILLIDSPSTFQKLPHFENGEFVLVRPRPMRFPRGSLRL